MTWLMRRRRPDPELGSWEGPPAIAGPKWTAFDPDVAVTALLATPFVDRHIEGRPAAYDDCERCGRHLGAEGECGTETLKGCGAPRTRCRYCGTTIYPRAVTCLEHSGMRD